MTPINFPVFVDGEQMIASVIDEIIPPHQFIFKVRFSNGYEDLFYLGDAGIHGGRANSPAYAKAISMDIDHVLGLDPERFYHIFQEEIDGLMTNVWVIEKEDSSKVYYAVYYNRLYRFELTRENSQWIVSTKAKIYPNIKFELAKKIGFLLDSYI